MYWTIGILLVLLVSYGIYTDKKSKCCKDGKVQWCEIECKKGDK